MSYKVPEYTVVENLHIEKRYYTKAESFFFIKFIQSFDIKGDANHWAAKGLFYFLRGFLSIPAALLDIILLTAVFLIIKPFYQL